jgi:hypothetical protein
VSPELTGEPIRSSLQNGEATVTVKVREEDLLGLQALAGVAGVSSADSGSFAELLRTTLHRGVVESYRTAGLTWPPRAVAGDGQAEAPARPMRGVTRREFAFGAAAVATIVVIIGSYAGGWTWTGLQKNGQVWDWMQLLFLPVAIGTVDRDLRRAGADQGRDRERGGERRRRVNLVLTAVADGCPTGAGR